MRLNWQDHDGRIDIPAVFGRLPGGSLLLDERACDWIEELVALARRLVARRPH